LSNSLSLKWFSYAKGACSTRSIARGDPGELVRDQERVLASLMPREERMLRVRFGIGMEELSQQVSVTRERVRQIEAKALRKLNYPSRSRELWSFLDN